MRNLYDVNLLTKFVIWYQGRLGGFKVANNLLGTRPALLQFWSLAIRISANFMCFRNVVRRILKLQNCERFDPTDSFTILECHKLSIDSSWPHKVRWIERLKNCKRVLWSFFD